MAKPKGLIIEEDLIAQEFDLSEITGRDFTDAQDLSSQIGDAITNFIKERAAQNKGIGGKALRSPYSKEYQKSTEFELYGKSANDVNMKLTGDMLDAINVLDIQDSTILVGIEDENAPKAHGHMTGKNGEVPKMKREFFGLTQSEFKEVIKQFKSDINDLPKKDTSFSGLTNQEIQDIQTIGKIGDLFTFEES